MITCRCVELSEQHRTYAAHQGCAPDTLKARVVALRRLTDHLHSLDEHLLSATPAGLQSWQGSLTCGPDGRRGLTVHARAWFRWAIKLEMVRPALIDALELPRIARRQPRPIRDADLTVALVTASSRLRPWLMVAALLGLRCVEIATLRWEHLDLDGEEPNLVVYGKGGHQRTMPLSPGLVLELRADLSPVRRRGWIFPAYRMCDHTPDWSRHVSRSQVSKLGNRFLHATGTSSTMHTLRHRFGTDALRNGADLALVAQLMGHKSMQTTRGYTEVSSAEARRVCEVLSQRRLDPAGEQRILSAT